MLKPEPWLIELIKENGTPHFLFDLHIIRKQISSLRQLLPNVTLYYSTKTNSEPAIIDTCIHEKMRFDAATIGEIELLIGRDVQPSAILYTHPVKTVSEIRIAYDAGVRQFTCDSLVELIKLNNNAPGGKFFIRFSPAKSASLYDYKQRLGASAGELKVLLDYAVQNKIDIQGLSFHVGSQSMNIDPWVKALHQSREIIKRYYSLLPTLRSVNIGSGFPVDYGFGRTPSLPDIAQRITKELKTFPEDISFMAEPGRIIAGPAGILAVSVVEKLQRGKKNWLFTDTTVYSGLVERIESGGRFSYPVSSPVTDKPLHNYDIAGKTLDPDDIIATEAPLSSALKSGDLLIIHNAGAYTIEFFTVYHRLPRPLVSFYDSEHANNVAILNSSVSHKGVRAKRSIAENETIFTVSGHRSKERSRTSFQINDNLHVEPTLYGAYLNHSCAPNAGIRTNAGGMLNVVARKPIHSGDEVTVDYAMFEYELADMAQTLCLCKTPECRETILGYKHLPIYKKKEYKTHTAHHLVHKEKNPKVVPVAN